MRIPASLRRRPLDFVDRQRATGAPVTRFVLRRRPAYLVHDPGLVWRLLTELSGQVGRGRTGDKTRALTGNGLGSVDGDFHRRQRRLIQPVFQRDQADAQVPALREAVERHTAGWTEDQPMDFAAQMLTVAATGVLDGLFGVRSTEQMARDAAAALPVCLDGAARRAYAPVTLPVRGDRRYTAALARLHRVADALAGHAPPAEFLNRLRDAQRHGTPGLDDDQVHDEIMTMLVAGVETVATTVCWTVHLLTTNPEHGVRARAELEHVLAGRPVEAADLPRLEFLDRVLREALRLFPPVWLVRRRATAPLRLGGQDIAAGASIHFSPYGLHRDPRLHREPLRFDPERWLPAAERSLPRGAYLPFGAGVHRCVGAAFGVAEVMTILATILPQWQVVPTSARIRPRAVVTLRPDRMPVTVRRHR